MTDPKLARGLTKNIFREVERLSELSAPFSRALIDIRHKYERNSVDHIAVGNNFYRMCSECSLLAVEKETVRRALRSNILVHTSKPAKIKSDQQDWLGLANASFEFEKKKLTMIETPSSTTVSLHTIERLFIRSSFTSENLMSLFDRVSEIEAPFIVGSPKRYQHSGFKVATPFLDGLLLGEYVANFHNTGEGPTIAQFRGGDDPEVTILDFPFVIDGARNATVRIDYKTFIGRHELFDNQEAVREKLESWIERFRPSLKILKRGLRLGLADDRMAARYGPLSSFLEMADYIKMQEQIEGVFSTADWQRHVAAGDEPSSTRH